MSATAQQRMKIANAKAEKNITARGNVPKSTKPDQDKYPVSCDDIFLDVNENYFRLVLGCSLSSSSLCAVRPYSRLSRAYEWPSSVCYDGL